MRRLSDAMHHAECRATGPNIQLHSVGGRLEPLIKEEDRESFAAAAEVAVASGWHYRVVARWRDHVWPGLGCGVSRTWAGSCWSVPMVLASR
jgi:hypothetical protein